MFRGAFCFGGRGGAGGMVSVVPARPFSKHCRFEEMPETLEGSGSLCKWKLQDPIKMEGSGSSTVAAP